jgi:hypothetical protein
MNNPYPENVNVHKGHTNGERLNLASLIEKCKKYMYLCINVWIFMHVFINLVLDIYMNICMYQFISKYSMNIFICINRYEYTYKYDTWNIYVYIYTYIYIYIHIYITYTYIYMYIYKFNLNILLQLKRMIFLLIYI